jgi:hypothetical protein
VHDINSGNNQSLILARSNIGDDTPAEKEEWERLKRIAIMRTKKIHREMENRRYSNI